MTATIQIGPTRSGLVDIPVEPDVLEWGLNDISSSDAGRVQDANMTMHKNRVAQKRKLQLSWTNPTIAQASAILQMVDPEYFFVRYLDPKSGGYQTREFYAGDLSAPFRQIVVNDPDGTRSTVTSLSFNVIER